MRILTVFAPVMLAASLAAVAPLPAQSDAAQAAPSGRPSFAQKPTPPSNANTLSVNAQLVIVPTVVRDKHGALVPNLGKDDFLLQVDGKTQAIRYFDYDADVPLTLGLLIDTSRSQNSVLDSERSASATFLEKMLAPATATRVSDKAFIVQFAGQVELLQDITDSRPKLQEALQQVGTEAPTSNNTSTDTGTGHGHASGGTALYDAVFLAADEITAKQKGRKALILLTDGVDRNSKERIGEAIEAAQRADTIIYAIYFKGQEEHHDNNNGGNRGHRGGGFPGGGGYPGGGYPGGYPGGGYPGGYPGGGYPGGNNPNGGGYPNGGGRPNGRGGAGGQRGSYDRVDGKKILERMCGETGGRVFEVSKKEPVDVIYAEIAEELRSEYRLGFTPTAEAAKDGYHEINLTISGAKSKDKLTVQTRDGYYTGSE